MTFSLTRKTFLKSLALCSSGILPAASIAAPGYPQRAVRLVVPFAPGGNTDVIARLIAQGMAREFGQPVVVDNLPGANGSIGAARVATSAADGYTLLFGTAGTQAINQSLYANLSEKNLDDYDYIALVTSIPNVLVVNESRTPVKNVGELVKFGRNSKQGLGFGSPGSGSSNHLSGEVFKLATKLDLIHVPYKGSAPALTDLIGGQIDFIFENITPALPFIQSGKLKALAITSAERSAILPELPTMKESGFPDFVTGTWNGILAPKGTPPEILDVLTKAALKVAGSKDFKDRVTAFGGVAKQVGPQEFRAFTNREYKHWHGVIEAAGVQKV